MKLHYLSYEPQLVETVLLNPAGVWHLRLFGLYPVHLHATKTASSSTNLTSVI